MVSFLFHRFRSGFYSLPCATAQTYGGPGVHSDVGSAVLPHRVRSTSAVLPQRVRTTPAYVVFAIFIIFLVKINLIHIQNTAVHHTTVDKKLI